MKKITNANIGGKSFVIDEDAYDRLELYLSNFRSKLNAADANEVINELENRIAEIFSQNLQFPGQVVTLSMVSHVAAQLGMPDGSRENYDEYSNKKEDSPKENVKHRIYRNEDGKKIAGVCSGLSAYFDMDPTLVRVVMIVLLITGTVGLWLYLILWIVVPKAVTPAEKCELRGWPVTAENMARFSQRK